jgi:hypothetical protein
LDWKGANGAWVVDADRRYRWQRLKRRENERPEMFSMRFPHVAFHGDASPEKPETRYTRLPFLGVKIGNSDLQGENPYMKATLTNSVLALFAFPVVAAIVSNTARINGGPAA